MEPTQSIEITKEQLVQLEPFIADLVMQLHEVHALETRWALVRKSLIKVYILGRMGV